MTSSAVRGAVLVALAVLLGFLILRGAADNQQVPVSAATPIFAATPTATPDPASVALPTPTVVDLSTAAPNSQVSVLVANGSGVDGQAGRLTDTLRNQGFNTRQPKTGTPRTTSVIYYRPGFDVEAQVVRAVLNTQTPVAPMPATDPIVGDDIDLVNVDVLVLVGSDQLSTS